MVDYRLSVSYSVAGGRQQRLQLSYVNVSDGQWHTAAVDRVGQWMTLTLDSAEGQEVNETLGHVEGHVELRVSQTGLLAGDDVRFHASNSAPLVNQDFYNGSTLHIYTINHSLANLFVRSFVLLQRRA